WTAELEATHGRLCSQRDGTQGLSRGRPARSQGIHREGTGERGCQTTRRIARSDRTGEKPRCPVNATGHAIVSGACEAHNKHGLNFIPEVSFWQEIGPTETSAICESP